MYPALSDSLQTKLKQLKVRQQRIESRTRALGNRRARKDDTRRKILIGATVLARIEAHHLDHAELQAWLDAHLTREDDRALFDLSPRNAETPGAGDSHPHQAP